MSVRARVEAEIAACDTEIERLRIVTAKAIDAQQRRRQLLKRVLAKVDDEAEALYAACCEAGLWPEVR